MPENEDPKMILACARECVLEALYRVALDELYVHPDNPCAAQAVFGMRLVWPQIASIVDSEKSERGERQGPSLATLPPLDPTEV